MIAAVAAYLAAVAGGTLLVRLLLRLTVAGRNLNPWVLSIALGSGIGIGVFSLVSFLTLLFSSRAVVLMVELLVTAILAGLWFAVWRGKGVSPALPPGSVEPERRLRLLGGFCLAAVSLSLLWFVLFSLGRPHGDWDAWAIWNLRARFLVRGGSGWTAAFDPAMSWSHADYPLLLPLAVARLWTYAGSEHTAAPALIAGGFTFGTAALLYGTVALLVNRSQAMIATVVLLGAPYLVKLGAAQQADIPVAFFCLAAASSVAIAGGWRGKGVGRFVLAGLCAAFAGWAKDEGLVVLLVFAGLALLASRPGPAERTRSLLFFFAGAGPVLAAIIFFKSSLAPPGQLFADATQAGGGLLVPERYALIAEAYGREILSLGMALPVALGAMLVGRTADRARRRTALHLGIGLLFLVASHVGVYLVTPFDLAWHLATSLNRLLIQLWPTALLALFLVTKEPGEFRFRGPVRD